MEDSSIVSVPETLASRIQKLLGQGLDGSVVAAAVGCEPSYISQLMEDEEFKRGVQILRAGNAEGAVRRDSKWDQIEEIIQDKVIQFLPLCTRPTDLARMAAMANSAKRRASEYSGSGEKVTAVVNVVLPQSAQVHFNMNAQSQVVEVDGRSMSALPTKHLEELRRERKNERDMRGIIEVPMPQLGAPVTPTAVLTERKKVETILDRIGFADEPVPVPKVL